MNYYKPVNWPDVPINQLLELITIPPSESHGHVGAIDKLTQFKIFRLLNINVSLCSEYKIMLVYFPPRTTINIHTDKPVEDIPEGKLDQSVFLPLKSCDKLEWTWYEVVDRSKIFHHQSAGNWKTVSMVKPEGAKKLQSVICNKPFISNIGAFHSLTNFSNDDALAISIRLMPWSYQQFESCYDLPPIPNLTLI